MRKTIAIVLTIAMFSCVCHAKPNYLEFKPLSERIDTEVSPVTTEQQILPLITWGGDIATIHANGNSNVTQDRSIFARYGLNYTLEREDVFGRQVENYLSGKTPFLRGTLGMIQAAAAVTKGKPNVKPIIFYQMTWSAGGDALVVKADGNTLSGKAGGDALVVKGDIGNAFDLRGKTIAIQADGPHVDYAARILKDANLTFDDVNIRWLPDLTLSPDSPPAALEEKDIDAAFMIIPDALTLTSDGTIGTGTDGSVAGAKILISTKTASRVIADVYAVRADYYKANKAKVEQLAKALLKGEKAMKHIIDNQIIYPKKYNDIMSAAALLLLDDAEAIPDTEGLYADCQYISLKGNRDFFNNPDYLRRFDLLKNEISESLMKLGLPPTADLIDSSDIDYNSFSLGMVRQKESVSFDRNEVTSALINKENTPAVNSDGELLRFEIPFSPNDGEKLIADQYQEEFTRAIELASVYEGAIVVIEGHVDPTEYLIKDRENASFFELNKIKQAARNLSLLRAETVKSAIFSLAKKEGITLNPNQFLTIGHGISKPKNGVCGNLPCAPNNVSEWRSNKVVTFRIVTLEAQDNIL